MPWGAVWGCVFFVAAELATQRLPDALFLGFDQHAYERDVTMDYVAVGTAIERLPPADVVVIGTSRAREGIRSGDLAELVREQAGAEVDVRNYGVAAGRADVWPALFDRLVSEGKPPRVLVAALDASDFRDPAPTSSRFRFVDLATLSDEIQRNGLPDETDMTAVLGNSVPLRLAALRPWIRHHLVDRGEERAEGARTKNTALGGISRWAREYEEAADRTGAAPAMRAERTQVEHTIEGYAVRRDRLRALQHLAAATRAAGVALVVIEIPPAPQVRVEPVVGVARARLHAGLDALAGPCLTLWKADAVEDDFGSDSYRDPSHLNARGARRLTQLVAPLVVAALEETAPDCSTTPGAAN